MGHRILLLAGVVVFGACSMRTGNGVPYPGGPPPEVVVIADDRQSRENARSLGEVPPGHYPPPGECRIWYVNRPPGHQPPPARCGSLVGRVPFGAFLLYNGSAWDTEYDWHRHETRRPGSVPGIVLQIMSRLVRG